MYPPRSYIRRLRSLLVHRLRSIVCMRKLRYLRCYKEPNRENCGQIASHNQRSVCWLTTYSKMAQHLWSPQNIAPDSTTALINQVQALIDEGVSAINLLISSPGGNVYAGMMAYNFLKGSPVEVITHNINTFDSIAAVIYAAGNRRLSVPHGRFLLHGPRVGFAANSNLSETELEERLATLKNDMDNIAGVLAAASGKEEATIH